MAIASGRKGLVKIGLPTALDADDATANVAAISTSLSTVRGWTLDTNSDSLDVTTMNVDGGFYRSFVPSFRKWSGSVDYLYDVTDAVGGDPDSLLRAGQLVQLWIFPESDAGSTATGFGGKALITSLTRKATYDGLVEVSLNFDGSGALTQDDTY